MSTLKYGILSKKIAKLMLYLLLTSLIIIPIKFDLSAAYTGNEVNWDGIKWILIDTDENEPGGENWRDVIAAYVSHDTEYLYLRLDTVQPPKFPTSPNDRDDDKYRWFIDLDKNMYWQGGVLYEAEYLISIQDKNDDEVGEFYLLYDSDNDSSFDDEQWVNIPVNDGGYRIFQNRLEIYISWSKISAAPTQLWLSYCTDRSDQNINQCPAHDRPETKYGVVIPLGAIQGYKWKDLNKNGKWDAGEPPLENWIIRLRSVSLSLTAYTNDTGFYQFIALPEGTYTVSEDIPTGWMQTYPGNNTYIVQITSGELIVGKNFGNFEIHTSIQLKKTANATMAHEGDKIEYTFNITNTGNVPLLIKNLTDKVMGSSQINQLLEPNESITISQVYSIGGSDPDYIVNVATVYATYDSETIWASDSWIINVLRPSIRVKIEANATEAYIGDTIQYKINVTNTGNCRLINVNVSSTISGKLLTNGMLEPKQSLIFIVNHIAQNAGTLTHKANASGIDELGLMVQDEDSYTVNILIPPAAASISITKSANVTMAHIGDTIKYAYEVRNIGNVPLTNIRIEDNVTGTINVADSLEPGEWKVVNYNYIVSDTDPDPLVNNATVYAKYNSQQVSAWDTWTVDILKPAIRVFKEANATMIHQGDWVKYNVTVVNKGDCDLTVTLVDEMLGISWSGTLKPGEKYEVIKSIQPTADPTENTASATGVDAIGGAKGTVSDSASWSVDILHPRIEVSKTANTTKAYAGDKINYTIIVKNTGDCPLYKVNVTDDLLGDLLTNGFLNVGENVTFTVIYIVKAGDPDPLVNNVTAKGKDALGLVVTAKASCIINIAKIQYKVTVDTNLPAVRANFTVTYTKDGTTYTKEHVTPWSELVDSGTSVTVSNPQLYVPNENGENGVRYKFTGFDPASTVTMDGDKSITLVYKAQWLQVFNASSNVKSDGTGLIVTVNGTTINVGGLPYSLWADDGSTIYYSYESTVSSTVSGKRYRLDSVTGPPSGYIVSSANMIIGNYITQYLVTFNQTGLDDTATGVVVTVGGVAKTKADLPFTDWLDEGTTYSYSSTISSSVADKRFRLKSVTGPASPIKAPGTVTGEYVAQYKVTFTQSGLDSTATGTVLTINGAPKTYNELPFKTDWLDHGSSLTFSYSNIVASSSLGKRFALVSVSHTSPLTITGPTTITGNYKIQYYLMVKTDPEGFNIPGSGWYDKFTQVTLEAPGFVPSEGGTGGVRYKFSYWDVDGTEMEGNPITVYMDAPHTATAHYTKQYYLRVIDNIGGLSGVSNQSNWLDEFTYIDALNAPQYVEVGEGEKYTFARWNVTFPIQMNSPKTVMAIYTKQYLITFNQTGLDETANGIILTVNGTKLERSSLPFSIWAYEGEIIEYKYEEVVSSTVSGKRFRLEIVTGPSSPIIVSGKTNINGKYTAQWLVIFNQTGLDETATGTVVTIEGEAKAYSELPFSTWVDDGSIITFSYSNIIGSLVQGKRFALINTSHPSPLAINAPTIVTGNYKIQYRLIVYSDHDYPSPSVGEHWYDSGTIIVAYVTSPAYETSGIRYRCTGWTGTGSVPPSGTETSVTFTINMPSSITWNWKTQYYLTVTTNPAEVLSLNPEAVSGGGWYDAGATATVNAVQNVDKIIGESRYDFRSWTGATPTGTGNQATVYMDAPKTAIANYQLQFKVTFAQTGVGTDFAGTVVTIDGTGYGVSDLPKSFWWDEGSTHSFAFQSPLTVGSGKRYVWTSTTGISTSQSGTLTISSSGSITGNYKTQYYLTVRSTYGTPGGEGWYDAGTTAYATVTPLTVPGPSGTRYVFTHWSGDASGTTSPSNPITMNAPKTAIANWKTQHLVTFTQTGLDAYAIGSILRVNGSDKTVADLPFTMWVDQNAAITYSYAATVPSSLLNTQYILESVTGPASPVTVTQPLTITGNYGKAYYLEVVSEYGNPYGSGWYRSGSTASFGVTTPVDHGNRTLRVFLRWLGDIELHEPKGTVTVTRPMRIVAQWQKMYLVTFNTTLPNNVVLAIPNVPTTLPPGMNVFGTYYPAGENVTVGPAPKIVMEDHEKTRYVFKQWSLNGQPFAESEKISFIVKQPYDFAVNYWIEHLLEINAKGVKDPFKATVTVTASNPTKYELSPESPIQQWIRQGTTATLTISTPNKIGRGEWAIFQMWSAGSETSRTIAITILSPTTIDAIFFKVNPVAMSIPYSIIAGLIAMLICVALIRKRKPEEKKRKRTALLTGTSTTATAIILAAIVSSIIAIGYGIKPIELIDFTNWAVIFLIIEAVIFFSASALIARKAQRIRKT